jgi:hypothetical protein
MREFVSAKGNLCFEIDDELILVVFRDKQDKSRFKFVAIRNEIAERFSRYSYESIEAARDAYLAVHKN